MDPLVVVCLGQLMSIFDATIVNVALPRIGRRRIFLGGVSLFTLASGEAA